MVRRKKRKGGAGRDGVGADGEQVLQRDKGVQMPPWTEALEIEYMNQD